MSLLLESSLCREGNERAFLIQTSRQKLFNSAELICSHSRECLKVRADFMHLVRCSALLALNSLTAIRVLAGTKNFRPVGFYCRNSTKSTVNPNTTIPQI